MPVASKRAPCAVVIAAVAWWLGAGLPARADIAVVASIPPVHSLAAMVMAGAGAPDLLLPAGVSPHGFTLSPSQARRLAGARVVFWIGPALEAALVRPLANVVADARAVPLMDTPGLTLHAVRNGHGRDHGHSPDHGRTDPHLWLDPANARRLVARMAEVLARADTANADRYAANAAAAAGRLDDLARRLEARLAPVRDRPFVVFHDAFQYLERRFGLAFAGALTIDPELPPGPRKVAELRQRLERQGVRCLFTEPQFQSRLTDVLVEGTGAKIGRLDPLGAGMRPGPDLYIQLLDTNADALVACLRP